MTWVPWIGISTLVFVVAVGAAVTLRRRGDRGHRHSAGISQLTRRTRRIAVVVGAALVALASVLIAPAFASGSSVTAGAVSVSSTIAGGPATYTVSFTTSPGGALVAVNNDSITLVGPGNTSFSSSPGDYAVNGVAATSASTSPHSVTIVTPVDVGLSTSVTVVASNTTNISTAGGSYSLSVNTSVDTTPTTIGTYAIGAGPAFQVQLLAGNHQTAPDGTAFAQTLSATVEDQFHNPVAGASVQFTPVAGGSGSNGAFAGTSPYITTSDSAGLITSSALTANGIPGSFTVQVHSGATTLNNPFTETIQTGGASQLLPTEGSLQSAVLGTGFSTPFSVTLQDPFGVPIPGTPVTFTAPSTGASGTFANGTNTVTITTNGSGVATATPFTANGISGAYPVFATTGTLTTGFVASNITLPGPPTIITATPLDASVRIRWAAPVFTGASPITAYVITPSSGPAVTVSSTTTMAVVGGLVDGTPYSFTVSAINAVGTGPPSAPSNPVTPRLAGYWLVASDGGIFTFGNHHFDGSTGAVHLNSPIVGMAATPDGKGYWLVASDGGIFAFGDAKFFGSAGRLPLKKPIVAMNSTADGLGYWLVASDGGIFAFGDAKYHGSGGSHHLNKPIVGMASTPQGAGYWLVASDGGIFSFGTAKFHGSTGAIALNKPIVGMAGTPDGKGYWLVASDGGIFTFGGAPFFGSTGAVTLQKPIVGMVPSPTGRGYWLVAADGGIFTFGDASFYGSTGALHLRAPIVGLG